MKTLPSGDPGNSATRLHVLREAIALLASSAEFEQTLASTISACLPAVADFGFFDAVTDDGVLRTARAYLDPETDAILRPTQWAKQERTDMNLCALSSGKAALHPHIDDNWYREVAVNEDHLALLRLLAFRSMITVPMHHAGELVGALTLFMGRSGRTHTEEDLELAQDLARLAAPVVVNQRLLRAQHKVEAALRTSEERLRLATEAGAIGIWEWDIAADRVTWSPRLYELHGIAPQDFGGRASDFTRTVHPDDREQAWSQIEAALNAGECLSMDLRTLRPDGAVRWITTWARVLRENDGTPSRLIGAAIDISERKRAEQRLQFLDALSEALRTADDADQVMEQTTRLTGEFLKTARCSYVDLEPDGSRITIRHDWASAGARSVVGTYAIEAFGKGTAARLRRGEPLVLNDITAELDTGSAAMFASMGTRAMLCYPVLKGGHLVAWMAAKHDTARCWEPHELALMRDVAERSWAHVERLRSTAALRRSEAHLSSLFQQTAAGVAEADEKGYIIQVNERYCDILGRSREQLIGQHIQDLTHPDDRVRNIAHFSGMLESGRPYEMEKRYLRGDGGTVWVSLTVSPVRDASDHKLLSVSSVVLDISRRKGAEQKLLEADRRKDEFLAMLAHELRNPLAPIKTAADVLALCNAEDTRVRSAAEIIERQTRHMASLVDDLLDVSRVTRGLITLQRGPVDLKSLVSEAIEQVRPLIEARRHRLTVAMPPVPAAVMVDRKRMVQVMGNLLNNAAKFTPEGGQLRCAIEVSQETVTLMVSDNGSGLTPELTQRAFELFVQGERGPDRAQGGLGIGLALVKSLVELHGGQVSAHSPGPGQGSQFSVFLPRLAQAGMPMSGDDERGLEMGEQGLNVLVVDDNADAGQTLATLLESLGHRVQVRHDAYAALELAASLRPDACILDIGLPGMDGNALARRLREDPGTRHAVLIAVTGYGHEHDRNDGYEAGFRHYFVKPVNAAELARVLAAVRPARPEHTEPTAP